MIRLRGNKAFTLVEMLVVIAIIATLTAIAVPTMGKLGMFGRDPLQVAARQTLVMLKAARIYAGAHNVDTAVVYAIGLHNGSQTSSGSPVDVRVIDGIAMARRLTIEEKQIYEAVLARMVVAGQITQTEADAKWNTAFAGSENSGARYLPFVLVKGKDGVFTPLERGAVLARRDLVNGRIYGEDADLGTAADLNTWGDEDWGLCPVRLLDAELNVLKPRTVKGSGGTLFYEYMPSAYGSLDLRFPAHVFKPSGVLQVPNSEKARFVITMIPAPESSEKARFLDDGKPVPAEEIQIYSTIGRIQAAS